MITKLTADNAELYYASRFAQINEALAAAGSSIVVNSLEDYFSNLVPIANLLTRKGIPGSYLLVIPADEEVFEIDANTRAISVPNGVKKNGIGVYSDHRAEMIVLKIDRYFDVQDLIDTKIAINWAFTPVGAKSATAFDSIDAFAPTDEINPGYVTFGFIITKDMTPSKGTLTFSVTFYNNDSNDITYSLNTLTASVAINDTLALADPTTVKSDSANYLGRLTNSVYVDDNISPVADPTWVTGFELEEDDVVSGLKSGVFSGLEKVAYLPAVEDIQNQYDDGIILTARAEINPATADVIYKWTFAPVDGTVETAREFETANKKADYFAVDELKNDGTVYYMKDALGNVVTTSPLTYAEAMELLEDDEDLEFFVLGTSLKALSAGNYQVHAQSTISAGKNYEKILSSATLKVNRPYFVKDEDGEIDELHPLLNKEAAEALEAGKELYVLTASRSSNPVSSYVLSIPAAVQPSVSLSVASTFEFGGDIVKEEIEGGLDYTYFADGAAPEVIATVTVDSANNEDKAGAFAVELISSGTAAPTLDEIKEKIAAEELEFKALPANGKFTLATGGMSAGDYMVRAINRRNGTYSVSEPSSPIHTSRVAPAITKITVQAEDGEEFITVLADGQKPSGQRVDLEITSTHDHYDFIIADNSGTDQFDGAETSYYIEEVDLVDGVVVPRELPAKQDRDEADLREIVKDASGFYTFSITADPGFYRIRTVNHYHGTAHTAYTDIFGIKSYM